MSEQPTNRPVVWLPPERLPVILGEKPAPRDKGSRYVSVWSRVAHSPRRNRKGEPYLPLYLGEQPGTPVAEVVATEGGPVLRFLQTGVLVVGAKLYVVPEVAGGGEPTND